MPLVLIAMHSLVEIRPSCILLQSTSLQLIFPRYRRCDFSRGASPLEATWTV